MNERIKEVLAKGGIPATIGTSISFTSLEPLEHLVKMVVRECALTAGLMEHEGRNGIGAQLLDNFGIEGTLGTASEAEGVRE